MAWKQKNMCRRVTFQHENFDRKFNNVLSCTLIKKVGTYVQKYIVRTWKYMYILYHRMGIGGEDTRPKVRHYRFRRQIAAWQQLTTPVCVAISTKISLLASYNTWNAFRSIFVPKSEILKFNFWPKMDLISGQKLNFYKLFQNFFIIFWSRLIRKYKYMWID